MERCAYKIIIVKVKIDRLIGRHPHTCSFVKIILGNQFFSNILYIVFYFASDIPVISPEVINQMVNEGDTALVTCLASGKPIPNISWYFNDAPVEKANTMKYMISEMFLNPITKNSTLAIMNLTLSDMGTYTCSAVNQVSSDSSPGVLTVNRKCCLYM